MAVATSAGMVYVWERESGRLLAVVAGTRGRRERGGVRPRRTSTSLYSAGDDGFMVSYTCDLCSMGTGDLKDAAEDREAQAVG